MSIKNTNHFSTISVILLTLMMGITATASAAPDIAISSASLDFGDVAVGEFRERILTVTNQGQEDLHVTDISCDDSSVTASPSSFTLALWERQEVVVRFGPSIEAALDATLTITSNDPDEGTVEISVTGWGAPYVGRALSLDGDGDYGNISDSTDLNVLNTNTYTTEAWYKYTDAESGLNQFDCILNRLGEFYFDVHKGGFGVRVSTNANDIVQKNYTFNPGTWYHVSAVNSSGTVTIYVNGQSIGSGSLPNANSSGDVYIGGFYRGGWLTNEFVKGLIDEVRIWNYARTQEEIQGTMSVTLEGNEPGLVGYWRFDEGTDGIAYDSTPNANDGNLQGGAKFVEPGAPVAPPTVDPNIAVLSNALDFGDVSVGLFEERTLTVVNTGESELHVTNISCNDNSVVNISPNSFTLAFGMGQQVIVRFAPTGVFDLNATLTIESNDPDESLLEISVEGTGVPFVNRALSLDGVDDYTQVMHSSNLNPGTGSFTIEFWAKPDDVSTYRRIIWKNNGVLPPFEGYYVAIGSSRFGGGFGDGSKSTEMGTDAVLTVGEWYHYALVRDKGAGNLKVYLNGISAATPVLDASSNVIYTGNLRIGGRGPYGEDFDGIIDEVRIWNIARTQEEIRASSDLILTGNEPGLVSYWRFDGQPESKTAYDQTANDNHGVLVGDAFFADSNAPLMFPSSSKEIEVSTNSVIFTEPVPLGLVDVQAFFVRNVGKLNLQVSEVSSSDSQFIVSPNSFTLGMGEGQNVSVKFKPDELYGQTGLIAIRSNDADESVITIPAIGTGVEYENKAMQLDGDGDYVQVLYSELLNFDLGDSYTIEGWFNVAQNSDANRVAQDSILADANSKLEIWATDANLTKSWPGIRTDALASSATTQTIIAKRTGTFVFPFDVRISSSGKISFFMQSEDAGASVGSEQALNDGSWHHFAVVKQGTESIHLFVDGDYVKSNYSLPESGSTQNTSEIFIGWRGEYDNFLDGQLDEIRIWNVARTPAEIQANRDKLLEGVEPGLVAYWRFDGDVVDASENGNDGTLSGNSTFAKTPWPIISIIAGIHLPKAGDYVKETVPIIGTAVVEKGELQSWIVDVARGAPPFEIPSVLKIGSEPIINSELAQWNTKTGKFPDDAYTLRLQITDKDANITTHTVVVTVDNTNPNVKVQLTTQDTVGDYTRNDASISVSGQTEAGAAVKSVKIVDQNGIEIPGTSHIVNIDENGMITGTVLVGDLSAVSFLKLILTVADRAGNEGTGESQSLRVDNDKPTAHILTPADYAYFNFRETIDVAGNASDALSGIATVEIEFRGIWEEVSGTDEWTHQIPPDSERQLTLRVRAKDNAGNYGEPSPSIRVNHFNSLPTANISFPHDNLLVDNVSVDVLGSTDDVDGDFSDFSWTLEYAFGADATSGWSTISQGFTPVHNGLLGQWDISKLNGEYSLRLTVSAKSTVFVKRRNIQVEPSPIVCGDVNGDGQVTSHDASMILQHIVGLISLNPNQIAIGDVTKDGTLSALDAALILQHCVGIIDELSCAMVSLKNVDANSIMRVEIGEHTGKPGELVKIPLILSGNVKNLLSGEIVLEYDDSIIKAVGTEANDGEKRVFALQGCNAASKNTVFALQRRDGEKRVFTLRSGALRPANSKIRIAFANEKPITSDKILTLTFMVASDAQPQGRSPLIFEKAQLNEGLLKVEPRDGLFEIPPVWSALLPNYPNPFNPETWIPFQLASDSDVVLRIYDIKGQLVRSIYVGKKPAGAYTSKSRSVYWDGRNKAGERTASGVYFYTLQASKFKATRKMSIVK